jgi:hypothetical protein
MYENDSIQLICTTKVVYERFALPDHSQSRFAALLNAFLNLLQRATYFATPLVMVGTNENKYNILLLPP